MTTPLQLSNFTFTYHPTKQFPENLATSSSNDSPNLSRTTGILTRSQFGSLAVKLDHIPPKAFPFMKLPPELRNRVYEECFSRSRILVCDLRPSREVSRKRRLSAPYPGVQFEKGETRINPLFLCVSKQVNCEAIAILYRNTFVFGLVSILETFLKLIDRNRRYLRNIVLTVTSFTFPSGFGGAAGLLADAHHLSSFYLRFYAPRTFFIALEMYQQARNWVDSVQENNVSHETILSLIKPWEYDKLSDVEQTAWKVFELALMILVLGRMIPSQSQNYEKPVEDDNTTLLVLPSHVAVPDIQRALYRFRVHGCKKSTLMCLLALASSCSLCLLWCFPTSL